MVKMMLLYGIGVMVSEGDILGKGVGLATGSCTVATIMGLVTYIGCNRQGHIQIQVQIFDV